jgi:hypothetical protein
MLELKSAKIKGLQLKAANLIHLIASLLRKLSENFQIFKI